MVFQVIWLLHLERLFNCMTSWLSNGPTKNPCRSAVNSSGVNLITARIITNFLAHESALFRWVQNQTNYFPSRLISQCQTVVKPKPNQWLSTLNWKPLLEVLTISFTTKFNNCFVGIVFLFSWSLKSFQKQSRKIIYLQQILAAEV